MADALTRNLDALGRRQPELVRRIRSSGPAAHIDCVTASDGSPVPRVLLPDGPRLLHSSFAPAREAERLAAALARGEYLVCLGMGGGYHLTHLLGRPEVQRLLVVERALPDLRALLQYVDLSSVLTDARTHVLVAQEPADLGSFLLADYHPVLYRSVATVPLSSRVATDPIHFGALTQAVRSALDAVGRDHTTQTRFGLRWHRNIMANLRRLADRGDVARLELRRKDVLVAGAGPSLDAQMDDLRRVRRSACLVATDAALAPLELAGLVPDIVLSIDCQHLVYHHFLLAPSVDYALAVDMASPPFLARLGRPAAFLCAAHPLARYLHARGAPLVPVDAGGGNVGYAAVSLADQLGARSVRLFGVDLCYPLALPYARGTFFGAALDLVANRTQPLETALAAHVLDSPTLTRAVQEGRICYLTQRMWDYRRDMERLCGKTWAHVAQEPGLGVPLEIGNRRPEKARRENPAQTTAPHGEKTQPLARHLLGVYRDELGGLTSPAGAFPRYVETLSPSLRQTLATLLPLAAALQAPQGYPEASVLIESAIEAARSLVDRAIDGA